MIFLTSVYPSAPPTSTMRSRRDHRRAFLRDDRVALPTPWLPDGQAVRGVLLVDRLPVGVEQERLIGRGDLAQRGTTPPRRRGR